MKMKGKGRKGFGRIKNPLFRLKEREGRDLEGRGLEEKHGQIFLKIQSLLMWKDLEGKHSFSILICYPNIVLSQQFHHLEEIFMLQRI